MKWFGKNKPNSSFFSLFTDSPQKIIFWVGPFMLSFYRSYFPQLMCSWCTFLTILWFKMCSLSFGSLCSSLFLSRWMFWLCWSIVWLPQDRLATPWLTDSYCLVSCSKDFFAALIASTFSTYKTHFRLFCFNFSTFTRASTTARSTLTWFTFQDRGLTSTQGLTLKELS